MRCFAEIILLYYQFCATNINRKKGKGAFNKYDRQLLQASVLALELKI